MNTNIYQWAGLVAESSDEPSYNDIMILVKKLGKSTDEDTMSPEEYAKLSDEEKEAIHKSAKLNIDFDEPSDKEYDEAAFIKGMLIGKENKDKVYVNYVETDFKNVTGEESDTREIEVFPDMKMAKSFVAERMKKVKEKYGVDVTDFKVINTDDERFPEKIKEVDKNAIMLQCKDFEGTEKSSLTSQRGIQSYYKRGDEVKTPKEWAKEFGIDTQLFKKQVVDGRLEGFTKVEPPASDEDGKLAKNTEYSEISKDRVFTYVIYTAKEAVPMNSWKNDLAQALEWSNMSKAEQDEYKAREAKRKEWEKQEIEARKNLSKLAAQAGTEDNEDTSKVVDKNDSFDFDDTEDDELDLSLSDDELKDKAKKHVPGEDDFDDADEIEKMEKDAKAAKNREEAGYDYGSQSDDEEGTDKKGKEKDDTEHTSTVSGLKSAWDNAGEQKPTKKEEPKHFLREVPLTDKQFKKVQKLLQTPEGRNMLKTKEDVEAWVKEN